MSGETTPGRSVLALAIAKVLGQTVLRPLDEVDDHILPLQMATEVDDEGKLLLKTADWSK